MNPNLIEKQEKFIEHVPFAFLKIKEEELIHRSAPGKWSKKEIMGHLIDSARMNLQRFLEAQHTPEVYVVQRYLQDELVQLNDYQNIPTADIIQLWKSLNQQILNVFRKTPVVEFSATASGKDDEGNEYESGVFLYFDESGSGLKLVNVLAAG